MLELCCRVRGASRGDDARQAVDRMGERYVVDLILDQVSAPGC